MVRTNRSANALAFGARIGVRTTSTPSVRNTSSNGPENLASRSRTRKRTRSSRPSIAKVPGLLGHPGRVGVYGGARHVNPSGGKLDEEQHVHGLQRQGLHGEEVTGDQPGGLSAEELGPRGTGSARSGTQTVGEQQGSHRRCGDPNIELQQLASDPLVPPPGVLPCQPEDEPRDLAIQTRPSGPPLPPEGPLAAHQLAMPTK
jgi:hypothetical protein